MSMKRMLMMAVMTMALAVAGNAQGVAHGRTLHKNAQSGVTSAHGTVAKGPNGGAIAHGRRTSTDGQGSVTTAGGSAWRGPNGAKGARGGTTTVNGDGSATHKSGFAATGKNGSIESTGSSQRSADGAVSGERQTDITAKDGDTYQGETTWTKGQGYQHTGTCKDASGNVISCPKK
ncbi:hypothetical protein Acid345_3844 [Candidatus Koribacter versatilis Ellin345]|uniref:Uncharacterized protein n=2 Tax=Candidatus Korobacter versatilis TaxID=658062 RepID=Q1IJV6_KORVE|nr:hypothetical protein Acid345_3844 [Candidatus Koribacter versatilis Ellin345]